MVYILTEAKHRLACTGLLASLCAHFLFVRFKLFMFARELTIQWQCKNWNVNTQQAYYKCYVCIFHSLFIILSLSLSLSHTHTHILNA